MKREHTLEDGHDWSEEILTKMENANWNDSREAFAHLIHILPQIHETLEVFGYNRLAKKLQRSVDRWEEYF